MYCKRFLLLHLEMRRQVCVLIFLTLFLYAILQWLKVETAFYAFLLPFKDCNKRRILCSFCGTPHITVDTSIRFFQNLYVTSFENIGGATLFAFAISNVFTLCYHVNKTGNQWCSYMFIYARIYYEAPPTPRYYLLCLE